MRREVPDPWASAMIDRGFVYAKRPSIRALARAAGIPSSETVRQMIHGESTPDVETTNAVAKALRITGPVVREWIGQAGGSAREWQVPAEIDLLTDEEQAAISVLIRAIAKPRKVVDSREYSRRMREQLGQPDDEPANPVLKFPHHGTDRDVDDYDVEAAHESPEPAGLPEPESP